MLRTRWELGTGPSSLNALPPLRTLQPQEARVGTNGDSPETGHVSSMPEAVLQVPTSSLHLLHSPLLPEQAQPPALPGEELTLSHSSDGPQGCSALLSSLGVTFAWPLWVIVLTHFDYPLVTATLPCP